MKKVPEAQALEKQINMLSEWNERNIDTQGEIEQVRRNIDTICNAVSTLHSIFPSGY